LFKAGASGNRSGKETAVADITTRSAELSVAIAEEVIKEEYDQ